MAYTFFLAQGKKVGKSLVERDKVELAARAVLKPRRAAKIKLPVDTVISDKMTDDAPTKIVEGRHPRRLEGFDIGPKTRERYKPEIAKAKTVVWNGPMGVFEKKPFAAGTQGHRAGGAPRRQRATTIIGGGDSAAVNKVGLADKVSHVSTGGGASLEFLGGRTLPGVDVLPEK